MIARRIVHLNLNTDRDDDVAAQASHYVIGTCVASAPSVARAEQRLGRAMPGTPGVGRAALGTRIDGTAASIAEKQHRL